MVCENGLIYESIVYRPTLEDIVLPGRHLLVEGEGGLFDVSETASEAWSTDVITSDTERMAEVDTDETSSVARSETDANESNEQDSSTTSSTTSSAAMTHLGAIQRIRGRMSATLFRPIREVACAEQMANLSVHPRAVLQPEMSMPQGGGSGPMSSSSSSCSSHGSVSSSAKALAGLASSSSRSPAAACAAAAAAAASLVPSPTQCNQQKNN